MDPFPFLASSQSAHVANLFRHEAICRVAFQYLALPVQSPRWRAIQRQPWMVSRIRLDCESSTTVLRLTCASDSQWSSLPTKLLLAELQRRKEDGVKPECGGRQQGLYDTVAHVFALLLILVLSIVGTRLQLQN